MEIDLCYVSDRIREFNCTIESANVRREEILDIRITCIRGGRRFLVRLGVDRDFYEGDDRINDVMVGVILNELGRVKR